ncbi:MAG: dihydrodipicolinate reductase [Deltaproteobacteria bacterium]|nr:dihydrodipicolinate reductase [Deltaproteobacteria bacterium]
MPAPYRVVQWGTGNVGAEALRAIVEHPGLELAGVFVYGADKVGRDAGELCGLPHVGIRATNDRDAILRLAADCVAYMPRLASLDDVCALLASGKNVVATPFLFDPLSLPAQDRARLEAACAAGASSVHGTGIHPGFAGQVLPLVLSGMCRRAARVHVQERANWSFYASPRITFDNMRFGSRPEDATLAANPFARFNSGIFQEQLHVLARGLGGESERVEVAKELVAADAGFEVAAGRVERGGVCGQRYRWTGFIDGRAALEIEALWTIGPGYPESWPKPKDGWTVTIEGDPSLRVHFTNAASFARAREHSIAEHVHSADVATAMQAVNAIAPLCEAPPGPRTFLDLPLVRGSRALARARSESR